MWTPTATRADLLGRPPSAQTAAVSWRFVALASAGIFSLVTALNVSVPVLDHIYGKVYVASSHLITPTLMISGVLLVLTMVGLVSVGKLHPRDLGWESSKVGPGLALVAGTWIVMQLVELAGALVSGAAPQLSPTGPLPAGRRVWASCSEWSLPSPPPRRHSSADSCCPSCGSSSHT
jgi:hypothetical protein